jgi:hypothetical protein
MANRICAICGKAVAVNEPHFRSGIKWMHVCCYEERKKPKPPRRRPA